MGLVYKKAALVAQWIVLDLQIGKLKRFICKGCYKFVKQNISTLPMWFTQSHALYTKCWCTRHNFKYRVGLRILAKVAIRYVSQYVPRDYDINCEMM